MIALQYAMRLKSRVLIPQVPGGDPASYFTQWFIPGSILRGIAISRFAKNNSSDELQELFFQSDLRFLNAYPMVRFSSEECRSLPTPLSWRQKKDSVGKIDNLAFMADLMPGYALDKVGAPFCYLGFASDTSYYTHLVSPEDWYTLHIARPNKSDPKGDMFRYHTLNTDQVFLGWVLSDKVIDLEKIKNLFDGVNELRIGRSHQAEYGLVELVIKEDLIDNFIEAEAHEDAGEGLISMTCLSDSLVRDPDNGAYTCDIEKAVGFIPLKSFAVAIPSGGYNRLWNLPLPQAYAIKAGSTFIFEDTTGVAEKLKTLAEKGMGERTSEGFGRVAINWQNVKYISIEPEENEPYTNQPPRIGASEWDDIAGNMASRIFRNRVEAGLPGKVSKNIISNAPKNAQLSRLRTMLESVRRQYEIDKNLEKAKKSVKDYFDDFKRPAHEQFDQAKIGSERLEDWIKKKINDPQDIWKDPLNETDFPRVSLGDVQNKFEQDAFIITIRYIDLVLRRVMKSRQGGKSNE